MHLESVYIFLILTILVAVIADSSNLNGGTFLALAGRDCVVVATDSRYASLKHKGFLMAQHLRNIHCIGKSTLLGCFGLEADAHSLALMVKQMLERGEFSDDDVFPNNVAKVVSHILYRNNLVAVPLIAGLLRDGRPFLCSMDGIGAQTRSRYFAAVGTSATGLLTVCESLYKPDLDAESLVMLTERCLRLAFRRDVLSGGGKIKLVTLRKTRREEETKSVAAEPQNGNKEDGSYNSEGDVATSSVHPVSDLSDIKDVEHDDFEIYSKEVYLADA